MSAGISTAHCFEGLAAITLWALYEIQRPRAGYLARHRERRRLNRLVKGIR